MILGAVKVFDGFYGDFAAVLGIRPQRGASYGSKATPLLVWLAGGPWGQLAGGGEKVDLWVWTG